MVRHLTVQNLGSRSLETQKATETEESVYVCVCGWGGVVELGFEEFIFETTFKNNLIWRIENLKFQNVQHTICFEQSSTWLMLPKHH